jgi:hypothetical protein
MPRPILRQSTDVPTAMNRVLEQHGLVLGRAIIRSLLLRNAAATRTLLRISAHARQQPPEAA